MIVRLTGDEGMAAVSVGAMQLMRAINRGLVGTRKGDHGGMSYRGMHERWANSILGALAEYAACKGLGIHWGSGFDGIHGDDGRGLQFRATHHDPAHLIVNEADTVKWPDSWFVLIIGHWPEFRIVGGILGRDAKREKWFRADARPAAYWVPMSELEPWDELHDHLRYVGILP